MGSQGSVDTCGICFGLWGLLAPCPTSLLGPASQINGDTETSAFYSKAPRPSEVGKAIVELNNLVKATLELIDSIFELDNLSVHDPKDVPSLSTVIDRIPVDSYWAIITLAACTTHMCCISGNE
ncbi:hypothetical protein CJ030_MR3G018688 [Morella rubra]|uniref:Sieve element occlusion N-terminal domain-containing protein n=1 Tax=Morella rubra TaxID=262757 RepID=A0A6A1W1H6_9ROSI|nr:hypothetical protein CJ030_MR3G018688 [Morella rubra]